MIDKQVFGRWLEQERTARGWSQADFARECRKGRSVISKIEHGINVPSLATLLALAAALNIPVVVVLRAAGLSATASPDEDTFDTWKMLLGQLNSKDEQELRQIAELKIRNYRKE